MDIEKDGKELQKQEAEFCQRMANQVVDPTNVYFAAVNLSVDPYSHEYRDAILVGWFCLHGGLHALLEEFPLLKEHYGRIGYIPLHPEAYTLLQLFIAWRHNGSFEYVTQRMNWFRRRFKQIPTVEHGLFFK